MISLLILKRKVQNLIQGGEPDFIAKTYPLNSCNRLFYWDSVHSAMRCTPPLKMHTLNQKLNDSLGRFPVILNLMPKVSGFCSIFFPSENSWKDENPYCTTPYADGKNNLPIKSPLSIGGIHRGESTKDWCRAHLCLNRLTSKRIVCTKSSWTTWIRAVSQRLRSVIKKGM